MPTFWLDYFLTGIFRLHFDYILTTFWLHSVYYFFYTTHSLHFGCILTFFDRFFLANTFWLHSDYFLNTLWLYFGCILTTVWLNKFLLQFDYILTKIFWIHFTYILPSTFWLHSDLWLLLFFLSTFWLHFNHFLKKYILTTFSIGTLRILFGYFWARFSVFFDAVLTLLRQLHFLLTVMIFTNLGLVYLTFILFYDIIIV